jgi:hypothetical protein
MPTLNKYRFDNSLTISIQLKSKIIYYTNCGIVMYKLLVNYYLLMVGKKDGFEVIDVDRGVVFRKVDGVVEVVDVVPVVVRVVVGGSVILGML